MESMLFMIILVSVIVEVENNPMIQSTIARGRSQSMRPLMQRGRIHVKSNPNSETLRSSSSSASSSSNTNPIASTSTNTIKRKPKISCTGECTMREIDIQRETQHARNVLDLNLREASVATNIEHLNPTQDGVFARVRRILFRNGATGVIGAGIGVSGVIMNENFNKNIATTPRSITTTPLLINSTVDDMIDLL